MIESKVKLRRERVREVCGWVSEREREIKAQRKQRKHTLCIRVIVVNEILNTIDEETQLWCEPLRVAFRIDRRTRRPLIPQPQTSRRFRKMAHRSRREKWVML